MIYNFDRQKNFQIFDKLTKSRQKKELRNRILFLILWAVWCYYVMSQFR